MTTDELLSRDIEERLWYSYIYGHDQSARQKLIQNHMPLAKHIAFKFYNNRIDDDIEFGDYFQYANLGLIEAVDNYNIEKEVSFSTYASYRIKGSIINGISSFTEKREQLSLRKRLQKERAESIACDGSGTFKDLVDKTLGLAISFMLDDTNFIMKDPESDSNTPYKSYSLYQVRKDIKKIVNSLSVNEQQVIDLHYYRYMSFSDSATEMGITKGRVSQIHKNALMKIKDALENQVDSLF